MTEQCGGGLSRLARLSPAERSVFDVVLTGVHNRDAAALLGISEATVRSHLTQIYAKLEVEGRSALISAFGHASDADSSAITPAERMNWSRSRLVGLGAMLLVAVVAVGATTALSGMLKAPLQVPNEEVAAATSAANESRELGAPADATPAISDSTGINQTAGVSTPRDVWFSVLAALTPYVVLLTAIGVLLGIWASRNFGTGAFR